VNVSIKIETCTVYRYILFTDEAQFPRDGINNYHNEHRWFDENPYAMFERNFQHRFSINVWCGTLNDQLFGPFVLDGCLTRDGYLRFLEDHLTNMLDDVLLIVRHRMYFLHDEPRLILVAECLISWIIIFVIVGLAQEDLTLGHRDHQT